MTKFTEYFKDIYIKPLEGDELRQSMREYSMLGLLGCVGSIDCTFVEWDRARNVRVRLGYDGDKGQGVLFEVIVTHFKKSYTSVNLFQQQ